MRFVLSLNKVLRLLLALERVGLFVSP